MGGRLTSQAWEYYQTWFPLEMQGSGRETRELVDQLFFYEGALGFHDLEKNDTKSFLGKHVSHFGAEGNRIIREKLIHLNEDVERVYQLDVAMWYGAWKKGAPNTSRFLEKVFTLLYYGGVMFKHPAGWRQWAHTGVPVASVIAHGGRVLVQLPKAAPTFPKTDDTFFNWLTGDVQPLTGLINKFGTHGVSFLRRPDDLCVGRQLFIKEEKLNQLQAVGAFGHHFRLNVGLGGPGNLNPWTGQRIVENGAHGHIYMFYQAPTRTRYGAFMIGCESESPFSAGQTGNIHMISGHSEEFAASGGLKWISSDKDKENKGYMEMQDPQLKLADKYGSIVVDLVADGSLLEFYKVINSTFNMEHLYKPPLPPVPVRRPFSTIIPKIDEWKRMSSGTWSRSWVGLTKIDQMVEAYHLSRGGGNTAGRKAMLMQLARACGTWMTQYMRKHKNRAGAVAKLGQDALIEMQDL